MDDNSVDSTLDIAMKYPIKIIRTLPNRPRSGCACPYYLGYICSTGKYIFFLDGDMIVNKEWFQQAIKFMEENPDVGGVAGIATEERKGIKTIIPYSKPYGERDSLGGAQLFRTDALEKAGPINPYMYGDEDHELCYRIRDAGYKLVRLDLPMIHHFGLSFGVGETFKRAKYAIGTGQTLRYSLGKRYFKEHLKRLRSQIIVAFWTLSNLIIPIIVAFFQQIIVVLYILVLFDIGLFMIILCKKRNIREGVNSFLGFLFRGFCYIIGFLKRPKGADTFPTKVKVIKWTDFFN